MTEDVIYNAIDFAKQYFLLRKKEGRVYSDNEVASLPEIDKGHKHYHEWQVRKGTSSRLVKYLFNKKKGLEILEAGCGNGWLSAKLAAIPFSQVTGIDINTEELNQGKKVFHQIENIEFFSRSLQDEMLNDHKFDIVLFAASIQYSSSLEKVLTDVLERLKPGGEIHIMDSHFYKENDIDAARMRSDDYYLAIGFPEMSDQYFHHSLQELKLFSYDILYNPNSIINKLKKNKSPFYWICIRNNA